MNEEFELNGFRFRATLEYDENQPVPWDEFDGYGVVSEWTHRAKAPNERILCTDRGAHRYYDMRASTEKARRDGWSYPGNFASKGEMIHAAVEYDFKRLRQWCEGHWYYAMMKVELFNSSEDMYLGGIENDSDSAFLSETAEECAREILARALRFPFHCAA